MGFKLTVEEVEDRTLPEDAILTARVAEINKREWSGTDRQGKAVTREFLDFWFEVTKAPSDIYLGRKVKGSVPAVLNTLPNNRLRQWAEVLLQRDLTAGFDFDTDDLLGLSAEIVIAHDKARDGDRVFERVSDILPADPAAYDNPPF